MVGGVHQIDETVETEVIGAGIERAVQVGGTMMVLLDPRGREGGLKETGAQEGTGGMRDHVMSQGVGQMMVVEDLKCLVPGIDLIPWDMVDLMVQGVEGLRRKLWMADLIMGIEVGLLSMRVEDPGLSVKVEGAVMSWMRGEDSLKWKEEEGILSLKEEQEETHLILKEGEDPLNLKEEGDVLKKEEGEGDLMTGEEEIFRTLVTVEDQWILLKWVGVEEDSLIEVAAEWKRGAGVVLKIVEEEGAQMSQVVVADLMILTGAEILKGEEGAGFNTTRVLASIRTSPLKKGLTEVQMLRRLP